MSEYEGEVRSAEEPDRPQVDLSAAIDRLLANPELVSMVAATMGVTPKAPVSASAPTGEPTHAEEEPSDPSVASAPSELPLPSPDTLAAMAPLLGMLSGKGDRGGKGRSKDNDKTCLLRALKPYVSHGRREAIDAMIRISEISDLLKTMNR